MELEVMESGKCVKKPNHPAIAGEIEITGCPEGGFMVGCCIIHFWCWEPGHGLCC